MKSDQHYLLKIGTIITITIAAIANFFLLSASNLHPDEAYYWNWSRHLAPGYFDNSPLVAYVIRLFTLPGTSEFWVRFPAFLVWIFLLVLVYKFAKRIYRDNYAGWLGVLVTVFVPLVAAGSHIMTHDIPMIFFSTLTWYFLYQAVEEDKKRAWYMVGIFFGLALLSKFQAVLIAPAALVVLLARPPKRKMLLSKEPYLALAIALVMFIPVLYWNWQHQWAAFAFQFQHGVQHQANLTNLLVFISGQVGVFSPLFLFLIYYTIKNLIYRKQTNAGNDFLLSCFIPVFLFFGFTSLTTPAAPNWPAVGYFPAIVFLSGQLSRALQNLTVLPRRLLAATIACSFVICFVLLALIQFPEFLINTLGVKLSSDRIMSNSTYGWDQLGKKVDQILVKEFPNSQKPVPVFGDSYQTAAELQFYVSRPKIVFTTREAHRNQFDYTTIDQISGFEGAGGLIVSTNEFSPGPSRYYEQIELVDLLTIRRFGDEVRKLYIYRFQKLKALALYQMALHKPLGYPGYYRDDSEY
jgi:4-amino-4-deoxy-L-arabinose transferase-like glycosyltransferase